MKNPFKLSTIVDTVTNVGIGGAANVAMDYARANIEALGSLDEKYYNAIKIAVGAIGGSLTKNKYVHAATDGIATVGAANLIKDLVNGEVVAQETTTSGVPFIGRVKLGQRGFRVARGRKVAGTGTINGEPFMGK